MAISSPGTPQGYRVVKSMGKGSGKTFKVPLNPKGGHHGQSQDPALSLVGKVPGLKKVKTKGTK